MIYYIVFYKWCGILLLFHYFALVLDNLTLWNWFGLELFGVVIWNLFASELNGKENGKTEKS